MYPRLRSILIILFLATALSGCGAAQANSRQGKLSDADKVVEMLKVRDLIRTQHVGSDLNDDELFFASMKGMLNSLDDPYSMYLTPEEAALSRQSFAGEFGGIGAKIDLKESPPMIIDVAHDGPAKAAGLRKGDRILEIDGVSTEELDGMRVIAMLRGKNGTKVTVKITRGGAGSSTVTMIRSTIVLKPVEYRKLTVGKKTVGYIRITEFNEKTAGQFSDAASTAHSDGVTALVLDLRNNPGGSIESVRSVACNWIERDGVVVIEHAKDDSEVKLLCNNVLPPKLLRIPTAVLTNGHSASASEILASALQDHGKAITVGEKTYGKGVAQAIIDLPSGAELRLTTNEWLSPKRRSINGKGITPNIPVAPKPEDAPDDAPDPQFDAALRYLRSK